MFTSKLTIAEGYSNGKVWILPLVRTFRLRLPFFGMSWSRPEAVQVRDGDGALTSIRVSDRTRIWQVGLMLLFTMMGWLLLRSLHRTG